MIQQRVQALQAKLPPHTGLLITSGSNRQYVTDFASSAGMVLITPDAATFFIDFRYCEKAKEVVKSCAVTLWDRGLGQVAAECRRLQVQTLLVETEQVSVAQMGRIRAAMEGITVSDDAAADRWLTDARSMKTAGEIDRIRAAQQMTDETFAYITQHIAAGRTERDVMLDMEFYMRRLGCQGIAFDFIVVSGANGSVPHGVPGDKPLEKGDFVTMDFGARVDGYRSDMTRTVAVGCVSDEQCRVYETVLDAQTRSMAQVAPGRVCKDIDAIARDLIDNAGYAGAFGHGLGHSVGLDIHEAPNFNPRCDTVLQPGMIMTVEPGIYLEGRFGVRIEDMVVVTETGYEDLTHSPHELIIL